MLNLLKLVSPDKKVSKWFYNCSNRKYIIFHFSRSDGAQLCCISPQIFDMIINPTVPCILKTKVIPEGGGLKEPSPPMRTLPPKDILDRA